MLQPGLTAEEAAADHRGARDPGNALNIGGDVRVGKKGRFAVTIYSDSDYTSVLAAGDLVLDGELALDVQGDLTQGTVLTIMSGRSITGRFRGLPEGRVLRADGHRFRVSYDTAA